MTRIILAGYIGFGNLGDEAMLAGAIQWLRTIYQDAEIRVLSVAPEQTAAEHGVKALRSLPAGQGLLAKTLLRPRRWQTVAALWRADLVVWVAGSGIFSDARGCTIRDFWPLFRLLRCLARQVIFLSASAGPIEFPESAAFIRRIEAGADALGVRDPESFALMRSLAGDSPRLIPMADMALELSPPPAVRLDRIWREEGLEPGARYLAFCPIYFFQTTEQVPLARQYQEQFIQAAGEALDELAATGGLTPLFIPFQKGYDSEISQQIAARMKSSPRILRGNWRPDEMIGILGRMQAAIGVRFHSLVLSAMAQTPFVTIVYDDKSRGFIRDLGLEHLSLDYYAWKREHPPLDAPRLVALVREALDGAESIRRQLQVKVGEMKARNACAAQTLTRLTRLTGR